MIGPMEVQFDMDGRSRLIRKAPGLEDVALSDFIVSHLIGHGAFGKVYLANLDTSEQLYAIKVIRKDKLVKDNTKTMAAILIEFQVCFESDHPFLSSMDYFFMTDERLYFIMPFYSGGTLQSVIKVDKKLPEAQVKFYLAQLILGVGNIHESHIIHRDLKPDNLMLDSNGYLKIIDFGLARYLRGSTLASTSCGTP